MTFKYQILGLLFIISIHVSGQNNYSLDYEKVYDFANHIIPNDSQNCILTKSADFSKWKNDTSFYWDNIFNENDISFFKYQIEQSKKIKWNKNKLNNTKTIRKAKVDKIFKKNENGWKMFWSKYNGCLTTCSLPLFSLDVKYCICFCKTNCGYYSGHGSLSLYKYENNEWNFVKHYHFYVA